MNTVPDSVNIEMMFNASIEKVWNAWTNPELILRWFGSDPNGIGIAARLNVQSGEKYEITFQDSDGTEHTCSGQYREVEEWARLKFTWTWKSEPNVESLVTVFLARSGNRTQMQFEHAHIGTKSVHNYSSGWRGAFSKLENLLK